LGRPLQTVLPDGSTVGYLQTLFTTQTTDPAGHRTIVTRDVDGRVQESSQFWGTKELDTTYSYGDFDQVTQIVDPDLNVTTIGYDARGRKTSFVDPDAGTTAFAYNGFGDMRQKTVGGSTTIYHHDRAGRVFQINNSDGVTSLVWDTAGAGLLAQTTSPD